jgi:hypothetical protein
MSYTWAADWRGEDDEPGPRHDLRCPVLTDPGPVQDPEEDCTCRDLDGRMRAFHVGVQEQLDRFDSYGRAS